jgi:hypothetical protein
VVSPQAMPSSRISVQDEAGLEEVAPSRSDAVMPHPAVARPVQSPDEQLQVRPSPVNPAGQAQVKEPAVFVQVATAAQSSVPSPHSSMSVQVTPLPVKPALQVQVKALGVSAQMAFSLQLSTPSAHSSTRVDSLVVKVTGLVMGV